MMKKTAKVCIMAAICFGLIGCGKERPSALEQAPSEPVLEMEENHEEAVEDREPETVEYEAQEIQTELIEMPEVMGRPLYAVEQDLYELGLIPEAEYEVSDEFGAGLIIRASIEASEAVNKNTVVVLTVAEAEDGIPVPDVTGRSKSEAAAMIEELGLMVNIVKEYMPTLERGYVISQFPEPGVMTSPDDYVTVWVSKGEEGEKSKVPNLIGMTKEDAIACLEDNDLEVGIITYVSHDDVSLLDRVVYQSYSSGSFVDSGTSIDLRISAGME